MSLNDRFTNDRHRQQQQQQQQPIMSLVIPALGDYMSNPEKFESVLDYFYLLLDEYKKEHVCRFLMMLMSNFKNDDLVIKLVNDVVFVLLKNHVPTSHRLMFNFTENHQSALVAIFTDVEFGSKDEVLISFDKVLRDPLVYFLRMFIWDFCPNYRLQVALKLFNEFDERILYDDEKRNLCDHYLPRLVGTMLPYMVLVRLNKVKFSDKYIESVLYSDMFVHNIVNILSLIYRVYIVPTTMRRFMLYCKRNTIRGPLTDEVCGIQEYFTSFNSLTTSIHSMIKNLDITMVSDEVVGMLSNTKPPQPTKQQIEDLTSGLIGTDVSSNANRLLLFMSFFHQIFNYYHSVGSCSNDIVFGLNYDLFIRNYLERVFQVVDEGPSLESDCYSSRPTSSHAASVIFAQKLFPRTVEVYIYWIDYLLCALLSNECLLHQLTTYLSECRPNHFELFFLFLQTDCITAKNLTKNPTLLDMFDNTETWLAFNGTTTSHLVRLPLYFEENDNEKFVSTISAIFEQLLEGDYLDGPTTKSMWYLTSEEAIEITSMIADDGIRALTSNRFCWVRCSEDVLRYAVSALLAFILKRQTENEYLDPFLLGTILVLSQNFRQYHFLIAYVIHWHIAVFPDLYLRIYKNFMLTSITNIHLIEKLVTLFQSQLQTNCTYTPCEFIYGDVAQNDDLNPSRMSLTDYQHNLSEICRNLTRTFIAPSDELRRVIHFVRIHQSKIISILTSFKKKSNRSIKAFNCLHKQNK